VAACHHSDTPDNSGRNTLGGQQRLNNKLRSWASTGRNRHARPKRSETAHYPNQLASYKPPSARAEASAQLRTRTYRRLNQAIDALARLRTAYWLGDSAVHLHALASLIAQAEQLLPQAVHHARDQELTWAQMGELLGTTAATAARRYRNNP
jgi:hypothetical protein